MLKIIKSSDLPLKIFKIDNNKVVEVGDRANKIVVNSFKNNKFWNLMYIPNIKATGKFIFLIFNPKKIFNYFNQAFIKAIIF